ncbi:MAG: NAD(P)H-dependent glycerol-3-phosphate dehydrogenase [Herpetosiphon sp.]
MTSLGITVVGSGNWGTTLAVILARAGRSTTLLVRHADEAEHLNTARENRRALPDVPFPPGLRVTADASSCVPPAALVLFAVPSQTMRPNVATIRALLSPDAVLLSCAKGLEQNTLLRMSAVVAAEAGASHASLVGALSGPNIATEIAAGRPASTVVAASDLAVARRAQSLLSTESFRVYTVEDIVGVELAGALKNIIAIGAGIADGLGAGDNAKAAFMTRGLAEIARLGIAMGANPLTFAGLAGLGDLVATCASPYSRNRRLGEALGRGVTLADAQASLGQIAEGATTVRIAGILARHFEVEMPISRQLFQVLFERKDPRAAIIDLMQRGVKHELE